MKSLKGKFLVAMPTLEDSRFERRVIFLVEHGETGAMGIVINDPMDLVFGDIVEDLDLASQDDNGLFSLEGLEMPIGRGGPVDQARGFVLHSADYFEKGSSVAVSSDINLSANRDVLRAIAQGEAAPEKRFLALGYSGWSEGQLEREMAENSWIHVNANAEMVFSVPFEERYEAVLALLGLNAANFSATAGLA